MYMENIKGKTALITGASSGIGEATAKMLAKNGVNLILIARRIELLEKIASSLKDDFGVNITLLSVDISKKDSILKYTKTLHNDFNSIDILINNAGLALGRDILYDADISEMVQMIRVNSEGLIVMTRFIIPFLLKSDNAFIINIGSVASDTPYEGGAVYCATKSFVEMFTDAIRIDLMDKNIKVCNIKPGLVNTNFSNIRFRGDTNKAKSVYEGIDPLYAEDIADNIEYVVTRNKHVQISSITTMASSQGSATLVSRRSL